MISQTSREKKWYVHGIYMYHCHQAKNQHNFNCFVAGVGGRHSLQSHSSSPRFICISLQFSDKITEYPEQHALK